MPTAELKARAEVVQRVFDDVLTMMKGVDPNGDPAVVAERAQQAMAMLDEAMTIVPLSKPLTPEERARLQKKAAKAPDRATMARILTEAKRMLDDPNTPDDLRRELEAANIDDSLARLDQTEVLEKLAKRAIATGEALVTPPKPKGQAS